MLSKTPLTYSSCQTVLHPNEPSCVRFYSQASVGMAKKTVSFYLPYYLLSYAVRTGKISPETIKRAVVATTRSSAYIVASTSLFGIFLCRVRDLVGHHNRLGYFLTSLVVQFFMIFVEDKKRRKELALYQSNVVLEALFVMAVARGWVRPVKHGLVLLFSLSYAILLRYHFLGENHVGSTVSSVLNILVGKPQQASSPPTPSPSPSPSSIPSFSSVQSTKKSNQPNFDVRFERILLSMIYRFLPPSTSASVPKGEFQQFSWSEVVSGTLKSGIYGFTIQQLIAIIKQAILRGKPTAVFSGLKENLFGATKFALFLSLITLGSRALPKIFVEWEKNVQKKSQNENPKQKCVWALFLAGFLTGLSSVVWNSTDVTLILVVRALETLVNHALFLKMLPEIQYFNEFYCAFIVSVLMYAIPFERYAVRKGYVNFLEKATDQRLSHFAELSPILGKECGIPTSADGNESRNCENISENFYENREL